MRATSRSSTRRPRPSVSELARLVNALDPQAVVLGGGLGLAPGFRERVTECMRPQIYADATRGLEVLPGALGTNAGVIGAALAADSALAADLRD